MNRLKKIWHFMGKGRLFYLLAFCAVMISTLFGYLIPMVIQFAIDQIIQGKELTRFKWLFSSFHQWTSEISWGTGLLAAGAILVVFTVFQGVFDFFKARLGSRAAENFARNLRNKMYDHLQRLPYSYYGRTETGDIIQRSTSDVETIRQFMESQSLEILRVVIMIVAVIPIMLAYSVKMTIIATCLLPFIMAYSCYYFHRMKNIHREVAEAEADMSTVLQENLTGIRVVRAFCRQNAEIGKFDSRNQQFRDLSLKMLDIVSVYWALSALLCMLQIGLVLVGGIWMAQNGEFSVGSFMVFITYEIKLVWTIRGLGRVMGEMGRSYVSIGRISEILDEPLEGVGEEGLKPQIMGNIKFDNLSFSYGDNNQNVLDGISFSVKTGQTVGIVGPTGCGKSSLVNLLPRLFDYQSGSITLDGVELKNIDRHWLRSNIGVVLQEPFLFSRSVRENIGLGSQNGNSNGQEIEDAAKVAAIHDAILEFSDGYETMVGERGVTLSGGQKQRLAIARAIVNEPPLMIFDDSLSAVDAETDRQIQESLIKRRGRATTFIIAHRLATVMDCDFIVVLENGQITAQGSHETLLAESELYNRLWQIQTQSKRSEV